MDLMTVSGLLYASLDSERSVRRNQRYSLKYNDSVTIFNLNVFFGIFINYNDYETF